jgi:hypothetical protein
MREKMLKETRFWLGYISVFVILTLFVAGLLESIEWVTRLLKELSSAQSTLPLEAFAHFSPV